MMNQEDLFKKIGHILSELQEQYQYIAEHPQNLNGLEVELMLSNANFLTDHIQIVRKTLNHQELKAIPQQTETTPKHTPQESNVQLVLSEEPVQNRFEFEEQQVDQLFNRPLTPEEQEIIAKKQQLNVPVEPLPKAPEPEVKAAEPYIIVTPEPTPVTPVVEQNPIIDASPAVEETPVVEEIPVFVEEVPVAEVPPLVIPTAPVVQNSIPEKAVKLTLNELLANNRQATEKADHPAAEIKDLKQAISLNDKLLYVKDLFHGYNLAYAEVIDLLNKMPDFKSADAFLQHNYAVKNDWKNKQVTVDRFYQLLRRRFPAK
jgi:hypothetical protein